MGPNARRSWRFASLRGAGRGPLRPAGRPYSETTSLGKQGLARPLWVVQPISANELLGGGRMGADEALGLMNRLLWTAMEVAAPVLLVTLAVGVVISVLQVATELQEMTLSFIPKMVAAALVVVALGPWVIHR